jgi:thiamine biosynthesis lipoprotein
MGSNYIRYFNYYDNEIETITIIGSSSMEADALSTGVFSLGLEGGINFLQENHIKGIFITKDMKIYIVGNINYTLKDGVEEAYTIIKK